MKLALFVLAIALAVIGCAVVQSAPPQVNPPTLQAIQPLQFKVCPGGDQPCTPDLPLTAGSLRTLSEIGTCSAYLVCNTVSDSQLNKWQTAAIAPNFNGIALQYVSGGPAGYDTISFAPNTGWLAIFVEYSCPSGQCTLDSTATGTYTWDNGLAGDHNGDSSDLNWTHGPNNFPMLVSEPCELVVGWAFHGSTGGPWVATAGPGFTMRAQTAGALAVEDMTAFTPGAVTSSMSWNDYAHWDMGSAAFKMGRTSCGK